MPDITAISGALASIKASTDIAKAMIGIRDEQLVREKAIELTAEILSAHQSALAAQAAQLALIDEAREMKRQIVELEDWGREKERYDLTEIASGRFAYVLKPDAQPTEPVHKICAHCYQSGKKCILQIIGRGGVMVHHTILFCQGCKAEVIEKSTSVQHTVTRSRTNSYMDR